VHDRIENRVESWVPGWAADVIWYQIFPDRFRNGDPANDPVLESIKGAWPHDVTSPWQIHPWTADWYEMQSWEKANGKDIWYNMQRRRYGGDLQGIIDKLDYLQELGIIGIYLNPVFMSPSAHKYDAATYHHVDPYLGPDPEGDLAMIEAENPGDATTWGWTTADKLLLKLIAVCHEREMYIILDGVFNHMGVDSWAFKDVVEKQQDSRFKDWFKIESWDDPVAGTLFSYKGWADVKQLPELNQDENGLRQGPCDYVFEITRRWMDPDGDGDPSDGIDGWRLDVAYCVKHPFWKAWRRHVKAINPAAYLTAEIINTVDEVTPYLQGDEFDAVMNYNFAFACDEFLVADEKRVAVSAFDERLKTLREAFDPCVAYVQQNLFDSHDTARLASHIVNRDVLSYRNWDDYFARAHAGRDFNPKKPDAVDKQIQKLFVIFQMTYIGAPMIYYGDEAGMWGCNDPCCRKPMIWDDMVYDDERYLPDGRRRISPDTVDVDHDLLRHYQKMSQIRHSHIALRRGDFNPVLIDDEQGVYGFSRQFDNEHVVVLLNTGKRKVEVELSLKGLYTDILNDNNVIDFDRTGMISIPLQWGCILRSLDN